MKRNVAGLTGLMLFMLVIESVCGNSETESLIKSYRESSTAEMKLNCCIKMISAGLIRDGVKVEELKKYFGASLEIPARPLDGTKRFKIHFEPAPIGADESKAVAWEGWYLSVTIDRSGAIVDYWVSNMSK